MIDSAIGSGWRPHDIERDGSASGRMSALAMVIGTSGRDFIHRAGDGLIAPPRYTDTAEATTGDDVIDGGRGKDIIYGDAGDDVIIGGAEPDRLYGGAGRDEFRITSNNQINGLREYIDGGVDGAFLTIRSSGGINLTRAKIINVDTLIIAIGVQVIMTGKQFEGFKAEITGGVSSSIVLSTPTHFKSFGTILSKIGTISASSGNDFIHFDGVLSYGANPFRLVGGGGNDGLLVKADLHAQRNEVTPIALDGGDGDDALRLYDGVGSLAGGTGNDTIIGGKRADTINGGADSDILKGNDRGDSLTGGTGADLFVYTNVKDSKPGDNADTITDFSNAEGDRIDLSKIDADTAQPGDQAFYLIDGGAFTGHAGELIQTSDGTGRTLLQGDVNGDGAADFAIALAGAPVLVAGDLMA